MAVSRRSKSDLKAKNAAIDTQGTVVQAVAVDRIDFSGRAAIDEAKLDIGDLLIMSGNTGVRLRGSISGGEDGIQMTGRVRDVSAALLKRLWPPVIAPRTRQWLSQNVLDGHIGEGEFRVNLTADAMAKAQRDRWLPDNSLDFHFLVNGVTTGYFKDLPPLTNASGEVRLKDNLFTLAWPVPT